MKLDLTPYAREDLDPVIKEILSGMEPRAAEIHIGWSMRDWRAVVTLTGWVIVDVRADTATDVAELAIETLGDPVKAAEIVTLKRQEAARNITAAARDIEAAVDDMAVWRGVEIEVVD